MYKVKKSVLINSDTERKEIYYDGIRYLVEEFDGKIAAVEVSLGVTLAELVKIAEKEFPLVPFDNLSIDISSDIFRAGCDGALIIRQRGQRR